MAQVLLSPYQRAMNPAAAAAAAVADGGDARRLLLPPPGVHPNNAVFGAVALPKPLTWQRREHLLQRRHILARVGQLLKRNAQLVLGAARDDAGAQDDDERVHAKTWALARKLEVLIFLNSASLLEYSNVDSLARRVQALTTGIVNKKIRRETATTSPPPPPRTTTTASSTACLHSASPMMAPSAAAALPGVDRLLRTVPTPVAPAPAAAAVVADATAPPVGHRRPRMDAHAPPSSRPVKRPRRSDQLGQLLFRGVDELSKGVWGFVDGVQIMRCRAVNRAARALAPQFVTTMQVSCNGIQRALTTVDAAVGGCVLRACVNLTQLEVVALASGMSFGKLSMRAMNCPQRFVVTHDDHEQIVLALSEQLRFNAFPRLTRLGLTCLFTNEEADGEADVLLNNLMTGCCPQLEELCLPGNSFGDYGAMKIAQMLRSRVCPRLTRLDLRRNFIAEEGIRSLCHALADGCAPNLVELCLGGNTITDSCFHHVLFAMESRQLQRLRFLGIEMNYLTATSMEMLGRTIGKMVCPVLAQISYSDNSVDDADAKRLIATAVYQERMFRLRQQQLRRQQQQRVPQPHPSQFPYDHGQRPHDYGGGAAGVPAPVRGLGGPAPMATVTGAYASEGGAYAYAGGGHYAPADGVGPAPPYSEGEAESDEDDDDDDDDAYSSGGEEEQEPI